MTTVEGSLPLLGLSNLLQIAAFNHRDVEIEIEAEAIAGRFVLRDGEVVDAATPDLRGEDAVFALLEKASEGVFCLRPSLGTAERTIETPTSALLLRVAQNAFSGETPTLGHPNWKVEGMTDLLPVEEILQIFEMNGKAVEGTFHTPSGERRVIRLAEGGIVDVRSETQEGIEVLYDLLALEHVRFRLQSLSSPPEVRHLIDIASAILEGLRRLDEARLKHRETVREENPHAKEMLEAWEGGRLDEVTRREMARGYLPGGSRAPAWILARLTVDESEAVRQEALRTLQTLPDPVLEALAADPQTPGPLLRYFLCEHGLPSAVTAALENPATPVDALLAFIPQATADQISLLRRREADLRKDRSLRAALRNHPHCTYRDFLDALDREQPLQPRRRGFEEEGPPSTPVVLTKPPKEEKKEKVKTKLGPKEIQYICRRGTLRQKMQLVCGTDAEVAHEVISQPGLPEPFILGVAESTSAHPAALRYIASSSQFGRNPHIVRALLLNPKTPVPSSIPLLRMVRDDMIRKIADNRDLPDGLRRAARQIAEKKEKKR